MAAIGILALGIGSNTAIFSVVEATLLRQLPFREVDRLTTLWQSSPSRDVAQDYVSPANFLDWRKDNHSFEDLAAVHSLSFNVRIDEPERLRGARVSASLFPLLGTRPVLGRGFVDADDRPGAEKVVVLSDALWHSRFGGDPNVLGRTVTVNGVPGTVVGVMPKGFDFPLRSQVWTPLALSGEEAVKRNSVYLLVLGRLKPGVTLAAAERDLQGVAKRLAASYPEDAGWSVHLVPLRDQMFQNVKKALLVLFGAVLFVLLVACTNVSNLLLARALARGREIAIRSALGASRGQLIWQILLESVMISLSGGALGILLAMGGIRLLIPQIPADAQVGEISINPSVLAFTAVVSVAAGLLFGLMPALRLSVPNAGGGLVEGSARVTGGRRRRLAEKSLVVAEVALTLTLLAGAVLMIRNFGALQSTSPGFSPEHLLTARLVLPNAQYKGPEPRRSFFDRVLEKTRSLPGVRTAALSTSVPFGSGQVSLYFTIVGRPANPNDEEFGAGYDAVTPEFFDALRIPLLRGRKFTAEDDARHPPVMVISEAMARTYWGNENPIGQRVTTETHGPEWEIVGVVGETRHEWFGRNHGRMYVPFAQDPWPAATLVVASDGNPLGQAVPLRRIVAEIDRDVPVAEVASLEQMLAQSLGQPRFLAGLLSALAAMALFLAALGIYALIASSVNQRRQEIGVRFALGAQKSLVLGLIVRESMMPVLLGTGIGFLGAFGLLKPLRSLVQGVSPNTPLTLASATLVMLAAALVACYLPAQRAARIDPMMALRSDLA